MSENILNIPNIITFFRFMLIVPIIFFLMHHLYLYALCIFTVAAVSDFFDGYFARIFNSKTKIGAVLDPLADKLLINYTFFLFAIDSLIPELLFFVILIKDLMLIVGSVVAIFNNYGEIEINFISKCSTFLQMCVIIFVLFYELNMFYNSIVFYIFVYLSLASAIFALIFYINQYIILLKAFNERRFV